MKLVYQAYGRKDVMEQTLFSVVSLLAQTQQNPKIEIFIYTDTESFFGNFLQAEPRVKFVHVTSEDLEKWRGKINFVHRVKIEILKDAGERFSGPIYYCDGDTVFLEDPSYKFQQVSDHVSLMHTEEAQLGKPKDPLTKKIAKFIRKNQFDVPMGDTTSMWNAGVIGISQNNKGFFPTILELTDQMHSLYPKHVMEQLAVSAVLQNSTRILPTDQEILHYWNQKEAYQLYIQSYFEKNKDLGSAVSNFSIKDLPKLELGISDKPKQNCLFRWLGL